MAGSRPRALTRGRSLPHSQRKQARELLAALQKVVVPIYCTSFLAVEEDKQQKIARVSGTAEGVREVAGAKRYSFPLTWPHPPHVQLLQLWEKNGYFDDSIIQQLQSPALGLGQYQVSALAGYSWWDGDLRAQVARSKLSSLVYLPDTGECWGLESV